MIALCFRAIAESAWFPPVAAVVAVIGVSTVGVLIINRK